MRHSGKMSLAEYREFVQEPEEETFVEVYELRDNVGLSDEGDWLEYLRDVVYGEEFPYACCKHECQVEPDGYCEHGNPSVLIMQGLI